jgi:NADPH:quinone reductase-like Zn-dependent oxidoreductase
MILIMKAAQIKNFGGIDAIEIIDALKPTPQQGQVLVEVNSASLNRIDSYFRSGGTQQWQPIQLPQTLGGDFAGIVTEVGEGVTNFKIGDQVYGNAGVYRGGSGSLAEFVVANTENTALKPNTLDFANAAALPLAAASALQGIEEELKAVKGQKILIQGGAGGIGSLAIQIAKMLGAYVATTVGTDDVDFAKNLGSDEVIDYKTQEASEILKDYDGIFNTANPQQLNKLFVILKTGGKIVSMTGQPDTELAKKYNVEAVSEMTKTNTEQLKKIAELVDSGKLKVYVTETFTLAKTKDAFDYFETQHPRGKVVVNVI